MSEIEQALQFAAERCSCCEGRINFSMFEDTCDECCSAILVGDYSTEAHGHAPSADQQAVLDRTFPT